MDQLTEKRDVIFTEKEVAAILKINPITLMRMRLKGEGPPWFDLRNGNGERITVRYRRDLLFAWTYQNQEITKE